MIKKKALIELVRHRVIGEYQAKNMGKMGDQMLAAYIGRAFNSLLLEVFRANLSNFDPYTKEYTEVDIEQDSKTNVYYSELPAPVIQLPRIGDGIMHIAGMTSSSVEYVPMTNGQLKLIDGLEVDQIDDVIGYVFKNGRIEYYGMSATIVSGQVRMLLVIPFEEYAEDDYVQIPTGSDDMLIKKVLELIMGTPDIDKVNDGNSLNKNIR